MGLLGEGSCDLDALAFAVGQRVPSAVAVAVAEHPGVCERLVDRGIIGEAVASEGVAVRDASEPDDFADGGGELSPEQIAAPGRSGCSPHRDTGNIGCQEALDRSSKHPSGLS